MHAFWVALQFLTRLPVPRAVSADAQERGRSVPYYPVVGLLLGALLTGMQALLAGTDVALQSALVLLAWTLLTGGLHMDGLADSADAWAGSHGDRAKALRIMKDATSGPAGVAAVTLVLLVKFSALSVLIRENIWPALIIAPVLGRAAIVLVLLTTSYVRPRGLGTAQATLMPRRSAMAMLVIVIMATLASGWSGIGAVAAAAGLLLVLRTMMVRRLGGATGDTLGATCELVEAVVVVTVALIAPVYLPSRAGA